jgi:hypothetical protein
MATVFEERGNMREDGRCSVPGETKVERKVGAEL